MLNLVPLRTITIIFVVCVQAVILLACDVSEASGGERGVLGVRVTVENGWLTVRSTLDNSPASRKGLRADDRIVKIDGQSTEGRTLQDCLAQLAGAPGKDVTLTVIRKFGDQEEKFDVILTRESITPNRQPLAQDGLHSSADGNDVPVQWNGNKIVSRVLPYSDLTSLFIRLPIAHAAVMGKNVSIAVIQISEDRSVLPVIKYVAPKAEIQTYLWDANESEVGKFIKMLGKSIHIALLSDVHLWSENQIVGLTKRLIAENITVVIPSDLSENEAKIETVNTLHGIGALTVGRMDRASLVLQRTRDSTKPFNRCIRTIHTDVFSTVGLPENSLSVRPMATVAGIVALVLEKWPDMTTAEIRERIVSGARPVWQCTSVETGQWQPIFSVDPVTTEYKPKDERAIFRFRAVDAAGALGIDTEIPWFLNMLNCHKAWEITKGRGATVVVTDQGFHIRHPELKDRIKAMKHFGSLTFKSPSQHFHGTEMSRILLSVAPEANIIPVLCSVDSSGNSETLTENIAKSFRYAVEQEADIITSSWVITFSESEQLLPAVRYAVDNCVLVSWFHYPESYPGVLRSKFTYSWWEVEDSLGFADRFLTDPPGFHPVEIEAGLSGTAPQAAGIAALVKSVNPKLSPAQIEQLIFQCSTPIGNRIVVPDAYKAVLAAKQ